MNVKEEEGGGEWRGKKCEHFSGNVNLLVNSSTTIIITWDAVPPRY